MKSQNDIYPPQWPLRFLRFFVKDEYLEEIEGDMGEIFRDNLKTRSSSKAKRLYTWETLKLLRPILIKKMEGGYRLNNYGMLKNYIKIALRNLLKHKVFSFINIFGLAISMSICLLIILMVHDQNEFDEFHENKERIYRVLGYRNTSPIPYATTPMPIGKILKEDYNGVEEYVTVRSGFQSVGTSDNITVPLEGYFAGEKFFQVFSFDFEEGDISTALKNPRSIVLSKTTARKFFGDDDAMGKVISAENFADLTVTGVIDMSKYKTHFSIEVLVSESTLYEIESAKELSIFDDWSDFSKGYHYLLLDENKDPQDLEIVLNELGEIHFEQFDNFSMEFELQPLNKITPGKFTNNPMSFRMPLELYYFLSFLALVIIISACMNYTNLSLARALTRAREIGIRKVSGASRIHIFMQFLSEAVIVSVLALLLAIGILQFVKPGFTGLWMNQFLTFDLQENLRVYFSFLIFSIIVGIIAGLFPAIVLSSFKPIAVLKNLGTIKLFKRLGLKKILIVGQFATSLFFIITATLIYKQLNHMLKAEYGFEQENIVNVKLQGTDYNMFANEAQNIAGVDAVSGISYIPSTGSSSGGMVKRFPTNDSLKMYHLFIDQNYLEVVGLEIVAGRNFPDNISDENEQFIIVNEKAVEKMGHANPSEALGEMIVFSNDPVEIIGVVKDFYFRLLVEDIIPFAFRYNPSRFNYASIKLSSQNITNTIANLEKSWKKVDPVHEFDYQFFDDQLAETHQIFNDIGSIIGSISVLAVSIACLGMLGMVTFASETRFKEVGIRKVMGAEASNIVFLLSKGFIILLAIAIIIATPIAYFLNNLWLQFLAYRVNFSFDILLYGILIMLVLGLITVGSQTFRAALLNPSNTLRNE